MDPLLICPTCNKTIGVHEPMYLELGGEMDETGELVEGAAVQGRAYHRGCEPEQPDSSGDA